MAHPQFAVSKWIGHSITLSGKHYANAVPDELFDRAAGVKPTPTLPAANTESLAAKINSAQRQAQRQRSATTGNDRKQRMSA